MEKFFGLYLMLLILILNKFANSTDEKSDALSSEASNVLVLTNSNFEDTIKNHNTLLVEFYAPWCGHCKQLEPIYAAAAKKLKSHSPPVALGKVDATIEEALAKKYNVEGYPTLIFFKSGKHYTYDGSRDEPGIVSYMKRRADPTWTPPPEAVLQLTEEDFDSSIIKHSYILVEFYAPWCGHCKKLAPEYEKAAQKLAKEDPPIFLAAVDATKAEKLASRYAVQGYPTLKLFRNGEASEYGGPRDAAGIARWMIDNKRNAATPVNSVAALEALKTNDSPLLVGFFAEKDESDLYKAFIEATNAIREDFKSALMFASDDTPRVVLYMPRFFWTDYEPKEHVYKPATEVTAKALQDWIMATHLPLVGHYSKKNAKHYHSRRPLCLFFFTVDWSHAHRSATQLVRGRLASVAAKFVTNNVTIAIADEEEQAENLQTFQLEDSGEDLSAGCWDSQHRKVAMPSMDSWDKEHVSKFLTNMLSGSLPFVIKSQQESKSHLVGPVITLVGTSFDRLVNDANKDVLVEFYAPWCGHCKKLEPIYSALALELSSTQPHLMLAKIDATANDFPSDYKVEGFPTIFLASSTNKRNPVKYEGSRDPEDIKNFLKKHSTASFKEKDHMREDL